MDDALIFDWNRDAPAPTRPRSCSSTKRCATDCSRRRCARPTIDQKLRILHLLDRIGIDTADIGLPGAGPHVARDVERLAYEILDCRLRVQANCAARTVLVRHPADRRHRPEDGPADRVLLLHRIEPDPHLRGRLVGRLPAALHRRSDQLRRAPRLEGDVRHRGYDAIGSRDAAPVCFRRRFDSGASRLCIADTVGHATPAGARAVVGFVKRLVEASGADIGIDWHGHRDRDMGTINSLAALEAGATRVHGTMLGLGERVGNTPMDLLMVNLVLMGWIERDLTHLNDLVHTVSDATGEPIPDNYPVFGRDAFRTATGVHAAAVVKAFRKNDPDLADRVYSGVPARLVGRRQQIEIGPMSGKSNVVFWLEQHAVPADDELVDRIFRRAKSSATVLTEAEVLRGISASGKLEGQSTKVS